MKILREASYQSFFEELAQLLCFKSKELVCIALFLVSIQQLQTTEKACNGNSCHMVISSYWICQRWLQANSKVLDKYLCCFCKTKHPRVTKTDPQCNIVSVVLKTSAPFDFEKLSAKKWGHLYKVLCNDAFLCGVWMRQFYWSRRLQ